MESKDGFAAWLSWNHWALPFAFSLSFEWREIGFGIGPINVSYKWGDPNDQ